MCGRCRNTPGKWPVSICCNIPVLIFLDARRRAYCPRWLELRMSFSLSRLARPCAVPSLERVCYQMYGISRSFLSGQPRAAPGAVHASENRYRNSEMSWIRSLMIRNSVMLRSDQQFRHRFQLTAPSDLHHDIISYLNAAFYCPLFTINTYCAIN